MSEISKELRGKIYGELWHHATPGVRGSTPEEIVANTSKRTNAILDAVINALRNTETQDKPLDFFDIIELLQAAKDGDKG